MEGLTISEMAEMLGIKENAVKQRLYYANIKAFSKKPLYKNDDFETIKGMSRVGRPCKDNPSPVTVYRREYRARKAAAANGEVFQDKRKGASHGGRPRKAAANNDEKGAKEN
jgi:hypothetical protein